MDSAGAGLFGRSVLVTGGTGFVGSHICRRLVATGADVHVLVRPDAAAGRLDDIAPLTRWPGDVTDPAALLACCRATRPEVIAHLAADTGVRDFAGDWSTIDRGIGVNLGGTINMLRAAVESAAPLSVFLRSGGLEEYGTGPLPYDEEQRERPSSPYSASQVAATHYAQMLQQHVPFAIVTLRPALLYGPAQSEEFFIPALIRACLRGQPFDMTSGTQTRELMFVDDAIDAFVLAACRPDLRGILLNVGPGEEYRMREVAELIVELTGAAGALRIGARPNRAADLPRLVSRVDRASTLLGWRARTNLREGLTRTIAWYRSALAET